MANSNDQIGFHPTQQQLEEQIQQLPEIVPEKAVVFEFEDVAPRWNKFLKDLFSRKLSDYDNISYINYSSNDPSNKEDLLPIPKQKSHSIKFLFVMPIMNFCNIKW